MPKIRRSNRIRTKKAVKLSKQSESPAKSTQKNDFNLKESAARLRSESESDQEELQNCFACKQTHPPIRRYPKTHWIQCDNCDEWWHLECACVSLEDSAKYGHYKISFSCALCVLKGSPWIQSNHLFSNATTTTENKLNHIKEPVITTKPYNPENQTSHTETCFEEVCKTDKDCFVIIDNIPSPKKFLSSVEIRKECRKFPDINRPKHSFSLSKGGIALQFENKKQVETSLQNWPEEAFGTQSSPHKARGTKVIKTGFVKNVRLSLPINEIVETYKKHCGVKFASRLYYRNSNRPMPVVKIEFLTEEDLQKAKSVVLEHQLNGKTAYLEEERRVKVIRCFNCHRFGHISRICTYSTRCGICASEEHTELDCTNPSKCANCEGDHTASSKNCPVYQQVFQLQRSNLLC